MSSGIHFRRSNAGEQDATHQGDERLFVRFSTRGLGKPVERLEFAEESIPEFVSMRGACAQAWADEVKRFGFLWKPCFERNAARMQRIQ